MTKEILRIYICGAHSSGKTTLLNDLQPHLENVKVVEEVARGIIKRHGWVRDDFLPEKHPDVFQTLNKEIVQAQIAADAEYTRLGQDFICDRALDPIVYCGFYLGNKEKDELYKLPRIDKWLDSLRKSLVILVAPHEECIKDDSVRLTSTIDELRDFHAKFEEELKGNNIPYINLTVLDRKTRVETVLRELSNFRKGLQRVPACENIQTTT